MVSLFAPVWRVQGVNGALGDSLPIAGPGLFHALPSKQMASDPFVLTSPRTLYWTFVQILRTELFIIFVLLLLVLPKIRITHFIVNIKLTPFHGVTRLRHGNVYASLKIVIAVSFAEPGANATFIK